MRGNPQPHSVHSSAWSGLASSTISVLIALAVSCLEAQLIESQRQSIPFARHISDEHSSAMAGEYLKLIEQRHTEYSICAKSPITNERIIAIAKEVMQACPSSFNCQSTRFVVLLEEHHVRLWEIAKECFQATMSSDEYREYEKKLSSRQAGYGTVSASRSFLAW